MFEALFNVNKAVTEKLTNAGKKFAIEFDVPVHEINVRIKYAKNGDPYYGVYHVTKEATKKLRDVQLAEII